MNHPHQSSRYKIVKYPLNNNVCSIELAKYPVASIPRLILSSRSRVFFLHLCLIPTVEKSSFGNYLNNNGEPAVLNNDVTQSWMKFKIYSFLNPQEVDFLNQSFLLTKFQLYFSQKGYTVNLIEEHINEHCNTVSFLENEVIHHGYKVYYCL